MATTGAPRLTHRAAGEEGGSSTPSGPTQEEEAYARAWVKSYVVLVLAGLAVVLYVGLFALLSEVGSLRWRLERAVAVERNRQATMVRQTNSLSRWGNVAEVAGQRDMVRRAAGVIEIEAQAPLPPERLTVVTTPQPFRAPGGGEVHRAFSSEAAAGAVQQ